MLGFLSFNLNVKNSVKWRKKSWRGEFKLSDHNESSHEQKFWRDVWIFTIFEKRSILTFPSAAWCKNFLKKKGI